MGKSTHFIGQPLYSQVIKLLCKSKNLQISEDLGGERYTKLLVSDNNFIVNILGAIAAYCMFPKKPCINVQRTLDTQLTLFQIRRTHVNLCKDMLPNNSNCFGLIL